MSEASPRFRQDLATSPVEADGVACVDVRDPKTGASFRFYDFEYQLALQLNGQPVSEVVSWASQVYGAELTPAGVPNSRLAWRARVPRARGVRRRQGRTRWRRWRCRSRNRPRQTRAAKARPTNGCPLKARKPRSSSPTPKCWPRRADARRAPPGAAARAERGPAGQARHAGKTVERPVVVPPAEGDGVPDKGVAGEATVPVSVDDFDARAGASPRTCRRWRCRSSSRPVVRGGPAPRRPAGRWPWTATFSRPVRRPARSTSRRTREEGRRVTAGPRRQGRAPAPRSCRAPAAAGTRRGRDGRLFRRRGQGRGRRPAFARPADHRAGSGGGGRRGRRLVLEEAAPAAAPQAIRVHVLTPSPAAVYRWFERPGQVTAAEMLALSFSTAGRLTEMLPSGTELKPGDVVGKLQAAAPIEAALEHHRSRIGFYKQVRDAMRVGNGAAAHHAEVMLAEKERLAADAQTALARYTIVAREPARSSRRWPRWAARSAPGDAGGSREEPPAAGRVPAGSRGTVSLREPGLRRVEVIGLGPRASNEPERRVGRPATAVDSSPLEAQVGPRFVDCARLPPAPSDEPDPGRAARRRRVGLRTAAAAGAAAIRRGVPDSSLRRRGRRRQPSSGWRRTTAPRNRGRSCWRAAEEALVSEGLRVGDQVVVDPPADLRAGSRLAIAP